jgi:glycosyltransferase involved in cell wall biosynthesis
MKLISVSMVRNEEYWIWYALTSVHPHVDEILVFDNGSQDATVDVVRGMDHIADKLTLVEGFGCASEHESREAIIAEARRRGGTHMLILDGDEIWPAEQLAFQRQLLTLAEHDPPLSDPPRNHGRPLDATPTDGALVKNIGVRVVHPGFAGPDTIAPIDLQHDHDHGCYNYSVRIHGLSGLRGNGLEWGLYGMVETGDQYVQSSPHTLWLARSYYFHMSWHPRSSLQRYGYGRASRDLGSIPAPPHVVPPAVLFRDDGPSNPTLEAWGVKPSRVAVAVPGGPAIAGLR